MILSGEGGTGKSKVIQTVTERFKQLGVEDMLVKAAYTGITVSLINGKTTHMLCMILHCTGKATFEVHAKLQAEWMLKEYLILDEYSMLSKSFLSKISEQIATAKKTEDNDATEKSFGSINVILCSDHHQFPPVACKPNEALYWPVDPAVDDGDTCIGGGIFREFQDIVILQEQMRVTDQVWKAFLKNL